MSYKMALWAFPGSVDDEPIVAAFIDAIEFITMDVTLGTGYITLKKIDGTKFAYLRATGRRPGSGVQRGAIHDSLSELPSAFLGHDDQNGVSIFDSTIDGGLYLMSDGPVVGGDLKKITVDYPQRGLPADQLDELFRRIDDGTASDRERQAVTQPESAIGIGMRQVFGWEGSAYVRLAHETQGYDHRTGEPAEIPADALPLVAFWPEDEDWLFAKLTARMY